MVKDTKLGSGGVGVRMTTTLKLKNNIAVSGKGHCKA